MILTTGHVQELQACEQKRRRSDNVFIPCYRNHSCTWFPALAAESMLVYKQVIFPKKKHFSVIYVSQTLNRQSRSFLT